MVIHALLCFPAPQISQRRVPGGGGDRSKLRFPDARRQGERLNPEFQRLADAITQRNIEVRNSAIGVLPDQVLVLETVGTVDNFVEAVKRIHGLRCLAEFELGNIEPDDDFYDDDRKPVTSRLFLVMTDARALNTLRLRFNEYQRNPNTRFPPHLAPLKHVFQQLRTLRFWGPADRLSEFGLLNNWRFRLEHSRDANNSLPFEAELWFKSTQREQREGDARFNSVVQSLGGEILRRSVIPEISYHGVLGRIPANHASELVQHGHSQLVLCEDVMFLRPVGQCSVPTIDGLAARDGMDQSTESASDLGPPVVALLDGLPLTSHKLLDGRLALDDPDGYEAYYQGSQRLHGTGMASLICHGELDAGEPPIPRRLYVRPVLRPSTGVGSQPTREEIPEEELPVDLIHRAVRRLFDGDAEGPPVAPEVRVVNLSVCDLRRPFIREMSPMARLLDWLAIQYQILFLVSAGNHAHDIELAVPRGSLSELGEQDRGAAVLRALASDTRNRSLLSPAETLNGLTVGAVHSDCSTIPDGYRLIDPFVADGFPNVASAHGPGFRGSVKPDILMPGGRQSLSERMGTDHKNVVLQVNDVRVALGQRVAWPAEQGSLQGTRYTRGTSNATALASRAAGQIFDLLHDLRSNSESFPDERFDTVLIKALLVHGADCETPLDYYASMLNRNGGTLQNKDVATRLFGYGSANLGRVMLCTDHRITVLGSGEIGAEEAHTFLFPAPPGLSGIAAERRMIATLAWLSPINCGHRNYRRAQLRCTLDRQLANTPVGTTQPRVRRGTVQHEVLVGKGAEVINEGDQCTIRVECRADAGSLDERVRYGLVVTLEVPDSLEVLIYDEIRARLSGRSRVITAAQF